MIRAKLLETIDMRAAQTGLSDRALSVQATGSTDTVRNIRRGAYPRIDTVEALFDALEMQIEITEKSIGVAQYILPKITNAALRAFNKGQTRSGREQLKKLNKKINSDNPALKAADVDKEGGLAQIISLFATEWEGCDAHDQAHLAARFHAYFPELGGKPSHRELP